MEKREEIIKIHMRFQRNRSLTGIGSPKIKLDVKESKGAKKTSTAQFPTALLRDEMESHVLIVSYTGVCISVPPFELSSSGFLCLMQKLKNPSK